MANISWPVAHSLCGRSELQEIVWLPNVRPRKRTLRTCFQNNDRKMNTLACNWNICAAGVNTRTPLSKAYDILQHMNTHDTSWKFMEHLHKTGRPRHPCDSTTLSNLFCVPDPRQTPQLPLQCQMIPAKCRVFHTLALRSLRLGAASRSWDLFWALLNLLNDFFLLCFVAGHGCWTCSPGAVIWSRASPALTSPTAVGPSRKCQRL